MEYVRVISSGFSASHLWAEDIARLSNILFPFCSFTRVHTSPDTPRHGPMIKFEFSLLLKDGWLVLSKGQWWPESPGPCGYSTAGVGPGASLCWVLTRDVGGGQVIAVGGTMDTEELYSEADSAGCWGRRACIVGKEQSTSGRNLSPSV